MAVFNQSFIANLQTSMQWVVETTYPKAVSKLWWDRVAKKRESNSSKEILEFMLHSGGITPRPEGQRIFVDQATQKLEADIEHFVLEGLQLMRSQLEDMDAKGIQLAREWAENAAIHIAMWPQELVIPALLGGETGTGYDGQAFFSTSHPVHPYMPGLGTYANLFTSSASGAYPGAIDITGADLQVASRNLSKALAYIKSIKGPDGRRSRNLRPLFLMGAPALEEQMELVSKAEFISAAAGGPNDNKGVIRLRDLEPPQVVPELGTAFGGSDDDFYIVCEEAMTSTLGGLVFFERRPVEIQYYGAFNDADLARQDKFEWHGSGRGQMSYGHPYCIFKCKKT